MPKKNGQMTKAELRKSWDRTGWGLGLQDPEKPRTKTLGEAVERMADAACDVPTETEVGRHE